MELSEPTPSHLLLYPCLSQWKKLSTPYIIPPWYNWINNLGLIKMYYSLFHAKAKAIIDHQYLTMIAHCIIYNQMYFRTHLSTHVLISEFPNLADCVILRRTKERMTRIFSQVIGCQLVRLQDITFEKHLTFMIFSNQFVAIRQ